MLPDTIQHNQVWLLTGLIAFYLFFFGASIYFLIKEKESLDDYNKSEPFLHINLIRTTLLFASIGLPVSALFRMFIEPSQHKDDLWVLAASGALTFILFIYTFIQKSNLNVIKNLVLINYAILCLGVMVSLYRTDLTWYYAIGSIILLSVSTSFINSIRNFIFFSILVTGANFAIAFMVKTPHLHPYLYLFAVCCVLFVSLLLFVKNNQRFSFSETILNTTKNIVIVSNNKGEIIFVNNTFKETLGYSENEVLGDGWWKVRRLVEGEKNVKQKLVKGTLEKNSKVLLETKNKDRIWIQWDNNRLPNGTTIAIGTDITEKQEKEREFKHIVENAKDIIYTTDANGHFTYVNEIAIMATGYTREEFFKKDFKQFIHKDHLNRVIEHNVTELKRHNYETYIEFPVITKNNEELWLGQQIIFKIDPATKKFAGAQAICRDISERVKAEIKLNNYYDDLRTNYEMKQAILSAKTIEALAETVLNNLIRIAKSTQFITLNFITGDNFLKIFYIDVFNKKITPTVQPLNTSIKDTIEKITKKDYHHFKTKEDVLLLYMLDQPKFAKSGLIHEFRDNDQIIGFIGLYTDFHFDFATSDTHYISDISNYVKSYYIEFEKNKIIERKNKEIEAYSTQLEVANENLETRNKFQKFIIQSTSFDELNINILKELIADSDHAKTFSFNYLNHDKKELKSYFINKHNTFPFERKLKLTDEQIEAIHSWHSGILFDWKEEDIDTYRVLGELQQPITNIKCTLLSCIKPKHVNSGFITVYSLKQNIYSNYELSTLEEIANVLQVALSQFENKQLIDQKNDEIEAQNKNLAILNEAQNKLINNLKVEEVFEDLLDLLFNKLSNIERASILKFDFDKKIGLLTHISQRRREMRYKDLPFDQIFILNSFLSEGLYDVSDYDLKPNMIEDEKKWYYSGIRSAYALPIYINNKLYASINLFSNIPGNFNDIKGTITQIISSTQLIIDQLINKEIINEKNKNISANINYAKRIQDAFLPNEDALKRVFPKSFALLLQRDALGGDFYWVKEFNNYSLLAVGDCTGHGVSGALLSILSTTYLNTIIDKWQNFKPGIILDLLSNSIYNSFHQKNTEADVNDGLDISFCTYNKADRTLLFSGAMHTIYINRGGEVIEHKGMRKPIGVENKHLKANYDTLFIQLEVNDKVYMLSDGVIDQFSSVTEKRLGNKRFKEILLELETVPLKERKRKVQSAINNWRANANQTDDICIVSFEVD
jgi:PAS domain S-box-containing protein